MTVVWNSAPDAGWVCSFADQLTGEGIVSNIPFITGVDLLDGLEYLGFGGQLIVVTNGDITAVPTLNNLGIDCNLYFVTPPVSSVIS